jgi:hypothetical protein
MYGTGTDRAKGEPYVVVERDDSLKSLERVSRESLEVERLQCLH